MRCLKKKINEEFYEKVRLISLMSGTREGRMNNGICDLLQDTMIIAGKEVETTAKRLSDKARLAYEIRTRESYLNELYKELGKEYYTAHRNDEDVDFDEINDLIKDLKELRDRQQAL